MRKLTEKEIARHLAARATPEPPSGLADRIKADIPGSIRIERTALQPTRRWLLPPLVDGLQPSWLAAASVLLVLSVGIVAARIPTQPDDVWKWMALSGVVHIDDIVVTAPAPVESELTLVASAKPETAKAASPRAFREPGAVDRLPAAGAGGRQRHTDAAAVSAAAKGVGSAAPPPAAAGSTAAGVSDRRDETHSDAGRADAPVAEAVAPQTEFKEEVTVTGTLQPRPALAAQSAAAGAPGRSAACRDCVTVVVVDDEGAPLAGATVTLERIGQGGTWSRTARTDTDGTATFRGVSLSMYHVLVASPAFASARSVVTVTSLDAAARTVRFRRARGSVAHGGRQDPGHEAHDQGT
jgi:Carboxypeptidase regulatory-like domain